MIIIIRVVSSDAIFSLSEKKRPSLTFRKVLRPLNRKIILHSLIISTLMPFTGNLGVTHGGIFIAYSRVNVGMTPGWYFSFAILIPL